MAASAEVTMERTESNWELIPSNKRKPTSSPNSQNQSPVEKRGKTDSNSENIVYLFGKIDNITKASGFPRFRDRGIFRGIYIRARKTIFPAESRNFFKTGHRQLEPLTVVDNKR